MNPLRKEMRNSEGNLPSFTYDQVFGRRGLGIARLTRPSFTVPCTPQLHEPFEGSHYVAFDRKKGPIGYVGVYKGKQNCLYRFNYINERDYDGNKYLFKQVPPRNAIPGLNITNSMKERFFSIYNKDGTKINTFILLGRRNNILLFEAEDFSKFRCEINEYNYELDDSDENRETMESLLEIKEREKRSERELEREKDLDKKRDKMKEYPSSNNGSNHSRTKRKEKTTRALKKLGTKGINITTLNNVTRQRILDRAINYENAGSSESSPNYDSMIPNHHPINIGIPRMVRLNSEVSPLTAAASYSLERAGVYPEISDYNARLQKKRNEIRRRAEILNLNHGSSNENVNGNDLRRRLGMPSPTKNLKAKELMRKSIKKLLPKARNRLLLKARNRGSPPE